MAAVRVVAEEVGVLPQPILDWVVVAVARVVGGEVMVEHRSATIPASLVATESAAVEAISRCNPRMESPDGIAAWSRVCNCLPAGEEAPGVRAVEEGAAAVAVEAVVVVVAVAVVVAPTLLIVNAAPRAATAPTAALGALAAQVEREAQGATAAQGAERWKFARWGASTLRDRFPSAAVTDFKAEAA